MALCFDRHKASRVRASGDTVSYVVKEGAIPVKLDNYLGDLTDELDGDIIQEFAAAGPKSYAYHTREKKKVVLRVKGITQTREYCEHVNFDSVRELVEGYIEWSREGMIETPQYNIRRNKKGFLLKNSGKSLEWCMTSEGSLATVQLCLLDISVK